MTETVEVMASGDHHFEEGPRFQECIDVHAGIVDRVRRQRPKLFISTGDLFNKGSTGIEQLALADTAEGICEVCPLIIVVGNHEEKWDPTIFAKLRTRHPIHVIEDARVVIEAGVAVAGLAWPTQASDMDEETTHAHLRDVLRGLGQELALWEGPRILAAHLMISGSLTGAGQPLVGGGLAIPLEDLSLARADAVILGHVHRAQEWTLPSGCPVIYTGSPYRTSFGELEDKSTLALSLRGRQVSWKREPTLARPMLHVSGSWDADAMAIVIDLPPGTDIERADIRLRYAVPNEYRVLAKKFADWLEANWLQRGAASVKPEPRVLPTVRAKAETVAIAKAKGLHAKIDAFWIAKSAVPEPARAKRLHDKLTEIEAS